MSRKIALVTGATRGIGLETVRQLAQAGVQVLLAGRDRARAEAAADTLSAEGLDVSAIVLDVGDMDSIAAAARGIEQRHGRLDILVNNAGILLDRADEADIGTSLQAWRQTFDTNVFGVIAVTQAFLPLLRRAEAGRIVNVSSILGSLALHSDPASPIFDFKVPAYNTSKSALNAWTVQLAWLLRGTPIKVNAIHPGYVRTDMNGGEGQLSIPEGARSSVRMALLAADGPSGTFTHEGEVIPW